MERKGRRLSPASIHQLHQVLKSFDRGCPLCLGHGIEHAGQPREAVCLFRVLGLDRAKRSDKPSTRLRTHVTRQDSQQFTECRIPSGDWPGIALGLPVRLGAWAARGAPFRQPVVIEQGCPRSLRRARPGGATTARLACASPRPSRLRRARPGGAATGGVSIGRTHGDRHRWDLAGQSSHRRGEPGGGGRSARTDGREWERRAFLRKTRPSAFAPYFISSIRC
jgi:hypothetical protein